MNKIKKEELETIIDQQTKLNKVLNEVGFLEARKHQMMHDMTSINKDIEDFKKVLEKQYGQININLEDGSYKEIEKENV
jgi:hypothetical protein